METKKQTGFTLVELLVVIAIIGLLASIVLIALNSARARARDARRLADVREIATALELYYNDNQAYPSSLTPLVPSYVATTPYQPTPADGSCAAVGANTTYSYSSASPYSTYSITFCLGGSTGGLTAGTHTASPQGIQ